MEVYMLGKRFKELRKELKLTQVALAKRMKVNPSAISQLESGKNRPSMENMLFLWKTFGVDLHWLITGEGTMFGNEKKELAASKSKGWKTLQEMLNNSLEEIAQAKMELVDSGVISIPVGGEIAAGPPEESHFPHADTITIRKGQLKGAPGKFISLRVNGSSMEPSLYHDDIVIIYQCADWEKLSGKICAVRIDGAITLKMMTLDHDTKTVLLLPLNKEYKPLLIKPEDHEDFVLIGNLASLYRRY